jgi:hypothetical protein
MVARESNVTSVEEIAQGVCLVDVYTKKKKVLSALRGTAREKKQERECKAFLVE